MKKIILAFITLLYSTTAVMSQTDAERPPKPLTNEERLKKVNDRLKKDLQLNQKQQQAVAAAYKTFFSEVDKLRKKDMPPPPPDREKVEPLAQKRDAAMKSILTADQYKKYIEVEKSLRPPGPRAQRPPKQ